MGVKGIDHLHVAVHVKVHGQDHDNDNVTVIVVVVVIVIVDLDGDGDVNLVATVDAGCNGGSDRAPDRPRPCGPSTTQARVAA